MGKLIAEKNCYPMLNLLIFKNKHEYLIMKF